MQVQALNDITKRYDVDLESGGSGGGSEDTKEALRKIIEGENGLRLVDDSASKVVNNFYSNKLNIIALSLNRCKDVGYQAFLYCENLSDVSLPVCETIGASAFDSCNFTSIDLPECVTIENHAFGSCQVLDSFNAPKCETIGSSAFISCRTLKSAVFPNCISIYDSAFAYCYKLSEISFPKLATIPTGVFNSCASISSIYFPECTTIGDKAFMVQFANYINDSLSKVYFSKCKSIGGSAFANRKNLMTISFPACETIGTKAFNSCNLTSAYFFTSSVPSLAFDAFSNTAIARGTGSIYVRASLLSDFQNAYGWSNYNIWIVGLTDEEIAALDNE